MDRADWLLLLVAAGGARPIDPVRLQKGLFLLAMEGGLPTSERYRFVPYSYGPLSRDIYADAEALESRGLLRTGRVPGYRWRTVACSPSGLRAANELEVSEAAMGRLREIRRFVDARTFVELLDDVYARYPAFAVRSVFRRPR